MKNIYFAAILFFSFSQIHGQTCGGPALLNEDFSSGIPASWTNLNLDANTLYSFQVGQGFTGQWQSFDHLGKMCAANASAFVPAGNPDDYLITPAINLSSGYTCLSWDASADSPFSPESYDVCISTTTPDAAGMQANPLLLTVNNENPYWTSHSIDLTAFGGQTVYIGFHYHVSSWAMYLDNIRISSPVSLDASVVSLNIGNDVLLPGTHIIKGRMLNEGNLAITSMDLKWNVNNGPVNSMAVAALNILPSTYYSYAHSISWNPSANGTYTIKVWADNINGMNDQYPDNDTLTQIEFVNTFQRKVLVEEYTQASCGPCGAINPYFDGLLLPNLHAQKVSSIKYHTSWPGYDPMYLDNPTLPDLRVAYYAVSAVPEALVDGKYIKNYNATWEGDPAGLTQFRIDSFYTVPALFDIQIVNSSVSTTNNVSITVTAKTDIPFSSFHLYTVIIEDSIGFGFSPGSNGEEDFYQVARLMLPNESGQALSTMTNNQSLTFNYSYPVTSVYVPSQLKTVAFVQDDATRKIYQSAVTSPYSNPLGQNEIARDYQLSVFPNPTLNSITVSAAGINGEEISWSIVNMIGEIVMSGKDATANSQFNKKLDLSTLPSGVYFLQLNDGTGTAVKRIVRQ